MQKYETRTAQLGLVSGIRQQQSDLITVVEPGSLFAPEARKGRLYIVVEANQETGKSVDACNLVVQVLRKEFYADVSFSVTSALRVAIRAANKALYDYSFKLPIQQRVQVGVTCAVVKDADLFITQVAPAQAYVLTEGQLRALPAHPSWDPAHTSVAPFLQQGALGASLFIEPEFYRCVLRSSDAAIICSHNFARVLGRDETERFLRLKDPSAVVDSLYQIAGHHGLLEAHALVVELLPPLSPMARQAPLSPAGVGERGRLALRTVGGWIAGITGEAALSVRPQARRTAHDDEPQAPDPLTTLPPETSDTPNPLPKPRPLHVGESLSEHYEREHQRPASARRRPSDIEMPPSAFLGEDDYANDVAANDEVPPSTFLGEQDYSEPAYNEPVRQRKRIDLGDDPSVLTAKPYRPRYEARPLVDLTWGERLALPFRKVGMAVDENMRGRRLRRKAPPTQPKMRVRGLSYRRQSPPFPWLLLTFLALLVLALIFYGTTLSQQNTRRLAENYLSVASERMAAVREAPNDNAAIEQLDIAQRAIDDVRASPMVTVTNQGLWVQYQELQREYERALAAVRRLTFFENPVVLATHPLLDGRFTSVVAPPATATAVVTDTGAVNATDFIYALDGDQSGAQLFRIPRDGGTPQPYLSPGDTVQSTVVSPVRAQAWREDQVVAVDQGPGGFGYYFQSDGAWNYTRLGASEIWNINDRLDMETYGGNLYVWGAQSGEILKYKTGTYGDTPELWLQSGGAEGRNITGAVDMAIDDNIYLLQPNGQVLIFSVGQFIGEIDPEEVSPPISAATRFFITGRPEEGWIFMLDPLNERVIQIEKQSGEVIQQIKMRPDDDIKLNELRDIYVDMSETRPVLYLANSNQIIRAELPDPPRPFRRSDEEAAPTSERVPDSAATSETAP